MVGGFVCFAFVSAVQNSPAPVPFVVALGGGALALYGVYVWRRGSWQLRRLSRKRGAKARRRKTVRAVPMLVAFTLLANSCAPPNPAGQGSGSSVGPALGVYAFRTVHAESGEPVSSSVETSHPDGVKTNLLFLDNVAKEPGHCVVSFVSTEPVEITIKAEGFERHRVVVTPKQSVASGGHYRPVVIRLRPR